MLRADLDLSQFGPQHQAYMFCLQFAKQFVYKARVWVVAIARVVAIIECVLGRFVLVKYGS